jgi:16S rRNA (cytidine1402-2'-O)-methyltransferase
MNGTLYVVATPIGNLEDITQRAINVLQNADIIAAEDTRKSMNLLNRFGINSKLVSNHKFNERLQVEYLVSQLLAGKNVAVISDAGTPCISDPGSVIVKNAVEAGIDVIGVCGASAVTTAISVSGFISTSFSFYGFLPKNPQEIKNVLNDAKQGTPSILVFYESPKRIIRTMELLDEVMPNANVCLCNDLTKLYERIYRGTSQEILDLLRKNPYAEKGEYTIVIEKPSINLEQNKEEMQLVPEAQIVDYMVRNNCTTKDAVRFLASAYKGKITKKELYAAALRLKQIFIDDQGES